MCFSHNSTRVVHTDYMYIWGRHCRAETTLAKSSCIVTQLKLRFQLSKVNWGADTQRLHPIANLVQADDSYTTNKQRLWEASRCFRCLEIRRELGRGVGQQR